MPVPSEGSTRGRAAWGAAVTLVLGLSLLLVSNGRWLVPSAIWVAAPLTLIGLRGLPVRWALACGLLGFALVYIVQSTGVINLDPPISWLIGIGFGVVGFAAYAADRLIAPRLGDGASTLVFPLAVCSVEHLTGLLSPYGTFGSIAYSQPDNLPLLQLLSVTGLWGVSFVIAWSASTAATVFQQRRQPAGMVRAPAGFLITLAAVLTFGEARLIAAPVSPTVRVAAISPTISDGFHFVDLVGNLCAAQACAAAATWTYRVQDELLESTRREARAGARLIVWSEDSGTTFKSDERAFIARVQALARTERVTVVMALQVVTPGRPLAENKAVIVLPSGAVAAEYEKSRPVPGDPDRPGDGRLPVAATDFGRLVPAICFDLDFPALMRQVGRSNAGLLVAPSSDWREIDPLHAQMAVFRAVENGVPLVRATRRGLFIATDPLGRVIGRLDFFSARTRVLIVNLPVGHVATLYPYIGDSPAWLGMVGLIALVAAALRRALSTGPDPGGREREREDTA